VSATATGAGALPGSRSVALGADAPVGASAEGAAGCPGCGAPLAGDERFCLACGLRLAPDELRLAALPWIAAPAAAATPALGASDGGPALRRPRARSAAIAAVVVLAFGVAIGATIGPAAVSETSAAQRAVVLVSVPLAPAPATPVDKAAPADPAGSGPPDEVRSLADAGASDGAGTANVPAADAPAETPPADDEAPPGHDHASDGSGDATQSPPGSQALAGVVVTSDADGFALAARDGRLLHVHASGCGVALGDDLHLRARPLANGTWAADRVRRVAAGVGEARVAGTVDWADPATGRYALGARGVTLLVAVSPPAAPAPVPPADGQTQPAVPPPATAPAASAPAVPALGARLLVRVAPAPAPAHDGQPAALVERARREVPPAADPSTPAPPLELAGVVQSADPQARALVLALDPDAQPPLTVALAVPPSVDLARLLPAQRLAVTATAAPDGTLALSGVSSDGDALAADDATALRGDQATSAPPHGEPSATTVATCTSLGETARGAGRRRN
jgi:hypothetical protein